VNGNDSTAAAFGTSNTVSAEGPDSHAVAIGFGKTVESGPGETVVNP